MSKGGFSISAAHAGQPRRAMYLETNIKSKNRRRVRFLTHVLRTAAARIEWRPHRQLVSTATLAVITPRTGQERSPSLRSARFRATLMTGMLCVSVAGMRKYEPLAQHAESSVWVVARPRESGHTLVPAGRRCTFRDYNHECVGNLCPRQVGHTYPEAVAEEWTAGDY